jgi:hypothetical protein
MTFQSSLKHGAPLEPPAVRDTYCTVPRSLSTALIPFAVIASFMASPHGCWRRFTPPPFAGAAAVSSGAGEI